MTTENTPQPLGHSPNAWAQRQDALLQFVRSTLWERKDTVPAACDQWLRMSVLAKLEGNTKLSDAIARTQAVHKLIYQKYVVKEVNGKRTLSVVRQPRMALAA